MNKFLFALAVVCGCLVGAPAAQAGFLYVDIYDGTNHFLVIDGGTYDTNGLTDAIDVDTSTLGPGTFQALFSAALASAAVSSTSNHDSSFGDGFSAISTSFTLVGKAGVISDFTITSGQDDFLVPGDPKFGASSGTFVFGFGVKANSPPSSATFQGSVGTTNGLSDISDTLILGAASNPLTTFAGGNGDGFPFSNGNSLYSIQNVLTGHLIDQVGVSILNQGTTIVQVPEEVPEPATIVMLATFVGPLALAAYRRRRSAK